MLYGHAFELMLKCHGCNKPAIIKSDDDGLLRCVPCYNDSVEEGCPWCGEAAPPEVGQGPTVNPTKYDEWIEHHVLDCEPFQREQGEAVDA